MHYKFVREADPHIEPGLQTGTRWVSREHGNNVAALEVHTVLFPSGEVQYLRLAIDEAGFSAARVDPASAIEVATEILRLAKGSPRVRLHLISGRFQSDKYPASPPGYEQADCAVLVDDSNKVWPAHFYEGAWCVATPLLAVAIYNACAEDRRKRGSGG